MDILKSIKAFLATSKPDPVVKTAYDHFSTVSDAFDTECAAIETHTIRANHHYAIMLSTRPSHDASYEIIARYTDPTDFQPYTAECLDGHTVAIDALAIAFDTLTAAFAALSRTDHLYKSAATVYQASAALYAFATNAYFNAVHCAMTTALEGNLQAAKDDLEILLLETKAENATTANAATVNAKLSAYRTNVAKNTLEAKRLEQKATEAQTKAEALCVKASSAVTKVTV